MKKLLEGGKLWTMLSIVVFVMTCGILAHGFWGDPTQSPFSDWRIDKQLGNTLDELEWNYLMTKLDTLGGVPAGAVMAFNLDACPTGWKAYDKAAGRSIRGIGGYPYYRIGDTGGSDSRYIETSNLPRHAHRMFTNDYNTDYNFDKDWNDNKTQRAIAVENEHKDGNGNYSYTMAAASSAYKDPTIGHTSYVGGGIAFDIDDPFVVLRYCEKCNGSCS